MPALRMDASMVESYGMPCLLKSGKWVTPASDDLRAEAPFCWVAVALPPAFNFFVNKGVRIICCVDVPVALIERNSLRLRTYGQIHQRIV